MSRHTADLCDDFEEDLHVVQSMFHRYGRLTAFDGPIATVKCYEDNSKVREALSEPGDGRIMVVDGGSELCGNPAADRYRRPAGTLHHQGHGGRRGQVVNGPEPRAHAPG